MIDGVGAAELIAWAVPDAMALGPAGEILRLAVKAGEERKRVVATALREAFAGHLQADGVKLPSSSWFVTARNVGIGGRVA